MSAGVGFVETLWAGFTAVNRRPGVLAIPAILDLVVWLGPRLTARPAVEGLLDLYRRWLSTVQADPSFSISPDQLQALNVDLPQQLSALSGANLVALAGWQLPGQLAVTSDLGQSSASLGGLALVSAATGLLVAGVILAAVFYAAIAQSVRGELFSAAGLVAIAPRYTLRLFGWLALVLAAGVIAGLPALLSIGLVGLISPILAAGLVMMLWGVAMLTAWWLAFATSAMFIQDVGPLRGILISIGLVGQSPLRSILFLALVWLLFTGWPMVWNAISALPIGAAAGIAGQAYLSSGLAAAMMIYVRDRLPQQQKAAPTSQPIAM